MATPETDPRIRVATGAEAVAWISGGWALFKRAPGTWIGMLMVYGLIQLLPSAIIAAGLEANEPLIGLARLVLGLGLALVAYVFVLGALIGAQDLNAGKPLRVAHLFAAFQSPQLGKLIVLALLSLVAPALALALFLLLLGLLHAVFPVRLDLELLSSGQAMLVAALILLTLAAVMLVIASAFLFAAPLVGFNGLPPMAALKLSLAAALKNWWSLAVWGVAALLLAMVGAIPFGLGLLVVVPVLGTSYYLMYRAIFDPLPVD